MIVLMFKLLCGHALGDFALQSDFMAKGKNRHFKPPGYDPVLHGPMQVIWPYVLGSHGFIQGLMVYLATGSVTLGILESVAHVLIDFGKCENWFGIHMDQGAHLACKVLWAVLFLKGVV